MWTINYELKVRDLSAEQIWNAWTDVNNWRSWQGDIDFAKLDMPFANGSKIEFRPKGGPTLKLELCDITVGQTWTDITHFPLAKLYDRHDIIRAADGISVKTTLTMTGPLSFVWRKLVGEGIANGLAAQTENLVTYARTKS